MITKKEFDKLQIRAVKAATNHVNKKGYKGVARAIAFGSYFDAYLGALCDKRFKISGVVPANGITPPKPPNPKS